MKKIQENKSFITLEKIEKDYWIVEAISNPHQITIIKKIEQLPNGINGYVAIGKKVASQLNLPFLKRNQTPLKLARKEQHRINRLEQKQEKIKEQWLIWLKNFTDEQKAIIEGISLIEMLFRDLALEASQNKEYLYYRFSEWEKELGRFVQFNELKKLWLRRNQNLITQAQKLGNKPKTLFMDDEEFNFVFDFKYLVCYDENIYEIYSDINLDFDKVSTNFVYPKSVNSFNSETTNILSLDSFVPAIEYGARNFWQKYWSKENKKLVFSREGKQ